MRQCGSQAVAVVLPRQRCRCHGLLRMQALAQIEAEQQAEQEAAATKAAAKKQAASAAKPAGLGTEEKARLKVGRGRAGML